MIMTGGFRQESAGHNFFTPGGVYTKCKGVYNKCCICAALCAANRTEKEQRRRMEQKRTAPRAQKTQPLTYREWKRRKQLRLARNWGLFLAGCALVVFLLTKGILWLLPHLHGADGPQTFAASAYDSTGYFFDADDARLVLVNANLPFDKEPSPTLDAADEAGTQLEAEAAQQYRSMAAAAQADGITLTLVTGYQDADTRTTGDVMMQDMADEKKEESSEKSAETPEKSAETPDKTADAPENHPDAPHEA